MLGFGHCKICSEKEARIGDLLAQVTMLRELVSPPTRATRIPVLNLEANAILAGNDEQIQLNRDQEAELERIESEAHRILSGTYDLT